MTILNVIIFQVVSQHCVINISLFQHTISTFQQNLCPFGILTFQHLTLCNFSPLKGCHFYFRISVFSLSKKSKCKFYVYNFTKFIILTNLRLTLHGWSPLVRLSKWSIWSCLRSCCDFYGWIFFALISNLNKFCLWYNYHIVNSNCFWKE